jgi:hypothetical protein
MNGHQLGSFETRVILLKDRTERVGELGGLVTIAFVLDIPQSRAYIAQATPEGGYLIDQRQCFSMNSEVEREHASSDINGIKVAVVGEIAKQ